jgi:S-adenosylmethionine hydrolase
LKTLKNGFMVCPVISLTTDFGLSDPYVAEMKAVILNLCPDARIVDISHNVDKFDIRIGAFILTCAAPYFPEGTVHVAVIDPDVGTKRRPLLIQTKKAFFIGPDNGVLVLAANNQGITHIYEITNPQLMLPKVSSTFHGRDIFAPAAAHLVNGTELKEFGPEIKKITRPNFAEIAQKKNEIVGEVLHIDSFGNIITNISQEQLESMDMGETANVKIGNAKLKLKLCKTYSETKEHIPLALIGSHGFLEISMNKGDAAQVLKIQRGDRTVLHRDTGACAKH